MGIRRQRGRHGSPARLGAVWRPPARATTPRPGPGSSDWRWWPEKATARRAHSAVCRLLNARYVLETEDWKTLPVTDDSTAPELLATGISAVKTGDLETAEQAEEKLKMMADEGQPVEPDHVSGGSRAPPSGQGARRRRHRADGRSIGDRGRDAAAKRCGQPGQGRPTSSTGRSCSSSTVPPRAVTRFETSLQRMRGRSRSLLGLARAAARSGDRATAAEQYATLLSNWQGRVDLPAYQEASRFVRQSNDQ